MRYLFPEDLEERLMPDGSTTDRIAYSAPIGVR